MAQSEVTISTPDGAARAFAFQPAADGAWPAVIFYMDAPAIRPALFQMCERLAAEGYFVLLPDMFWRAGAYEPINLREASKDEEARRARSARLTSSTDAERAMRDTGSILDWLSQQAQVSGRQVGCTGYCMGGGFALRAAAAFPDRIVAAAAFHPGRLATAEPDSPHLLARQIKATVYVGGADQDGSFPLEQADRLRDALTDAGVDNTVEIYSGARHGYAPPDTLAYDEVASERHWRELLKLLAEALKPSGE